MLENGSIFLKMSTINKKILIIIFSILLFFLQGCGSTEKNECGYEISFEKYTNFDSFTFYEESNGIEIQVTNNIDIEYPQVYNMKDSEKEKIINEELKKIGLDGVLEYVETQKNGSEPDLYNVKRSYIAYQNNDLLSVYFWGISQSHSGISSRPFSAITINLITGEKMTLDDFITINDENIDEFLNSSSITNSMIMELEENNESTESLKAKILYDINESKDTIRYNLLNNVESVPFYVIETSITIAITIRSASGSYALISIPRQ